MLRKFENLPVSELLFEFELLQMSKSPPGGMNGSVMLDSWSRKTIMRSLFLSMKGLTTSI